MRTGRAKCPRSCDEPARLSGPNQAPRKLGMAAYLTDPPFTLGGSKLIDPPAGRKTSERDSGGAVERHRNAQPQRFQNLLEGLQCRIALL